MSTDPPVDGRFKPGESGNPSGRPKVDLNLRKLAREHTETALDALVEIVLSKRAAAAARVSAAQAILDRGWGRPVTPTSFVDEDGNDRPLPLDFYDATDLEKARRIAHILAQGLRALPGRQELLNPVHPEGGSLDEQANRDRDLQLPSESPGDSTPYPESQEDDDL